MGKQIFVNEIIEKENGGKMGVIVWDDTIIEDIPILFDDKTERGLKHVIQNKMQPEGFYLFSRFYQFIVLFKWNPIMGISISLTDYGNDIDSALDEYLELEEKKWTVEDRNTIMRIFEEIRNDKSGEKAEMIIKFHVPA